MKHTLKVQNLFRKKDFPDNLPSVAPVVFQVKPDHLESLSSEYETSSEGTSDSLSDTDMDSLTSQLRQTTVLIHVCLNQIEEINCIQ